MERLLVTHNPTRFTLTHSQMKGVPRIRREHRSRLVTLIKVRTFPHHAFNSASSYHIKRTSVPNLILLVEFLPETSHIDTVLLKSITLSGTFTLRHLSIAIHQESENASVSTLPHFIAAFFDPLTF